MPAKIILIEDEEPLIKMYQEVFSRHTPFEFYTARSQEEGYRLVSQLEPDLVLLDLIIPVRPDEGVSYDRRIGFDLLKTLRQEPKLKKTVILVFSNIDTHEDRITSESLGAAEYLLKADYSPLELVKKIKQYLN